MERDIKILLGNNKSKSSVNTENKVMLQFMRDYKVLKEGTIATTVDEYEQYVREKDSSDIYRCIFTINPVCSNVLFNHKTEIVYKEGSPECRMLIDEGGTEWFSGKSGKDMSGIGNIDDFSEYLGRGTKLTRIDAIRDTSYSHDDVGGLTYHCGYDIFNNHLFRNKEFSVSNKINTATSDGRKKYFNTLNDYMRDWSGNVVQEYNRGFKRSTMTLDKGKHMVHRYLYDTVRSFSKSITDNLSEEFGWIGFKNTSNIDIVNYSVDGKDVVLNKVMNGNKSCEFIDMYPDRSLFSFIPKKNAYRRRKERNWDYCLTYPYTSVSFDLVDGGILCKFTDIMNTGTSDSGTTVDVDYTTQYLRFYTSVRCNISEGDTVYLYITKDGKTEKSKLLNVKGTAYGDYGFYVARNETEEIEDIITDEDSEIRAVRVADGLECRYYARKFRKIPNFKGTKVLDDGIATDTEILANIDNEFSTTINKVGFGKNIYNDPIAQIIYNDDVNVKSIRNNLGMPLSEIYLTIIKRNRGCEKWYKGYGNEESVEFSHCFGRVVSGLDLPTPSTLHNIHRMHDASGGTYNLSDVLIESDEPIESSVTIENDEFFGDIVELSVNEVKETVLESAFHRFNTYLRDGGVSTAINSALTYDEIYKDDYDYCAEGTVSNSQYEITTSANYCKAGDNEYDANVDPEGYYYKAHYPIKIREIDDYVNEGYHTQVYFTVLSDGGTSFVIRTDKNYYMELNGLIYLYDKNDGTKHTARVSSVDGPDFEIVGFVMENGDSVDISDMLIYKHNSEKPYGAVEVEDGSGRYVWREVTKHSQVTINSELYNRPFSNGAHYIHKNVNFFLRRQDPYGEYGLNLKYLSKTPTRLANMVIEEKEKDVTYYETDNSGKGTLC